MTDQDALTLTIWGEARGEPIEGKLGVANVMRNRLLAHYRGANSYVEVCTARAQFSAWTEEAQQMQAEMEILTGDPQLKSHPDPGLRLCWEIARATINGLIGDNTRGANHYYAVTIATPIWAQQAPVLATLGQHRFMNVA